MQNSKTPRSVSDSVQINHNGHVKNGVPPSSVLAETTRQKAILAEKTVDIDPVAEPDFLEETVKSNGAQPKAAPKPPSLDAIPTPAESTVSEETVNSRSLRLQWRFFRTLVFAGWLFVRVLFWQVYINKIAPDYVTNTNSRRWKQYAREFSDFATRMGGIYIKMGQFISTRMDILPEDILKELEGLQDTVPTIKFQKIRAAMEDELGSIEGRFAYFDQKPIAAASLGQVHRARLLNGDKVVVKVQRPGIREVCYTDLAAMRVVARVADRFRFINTRADAPALIEEFGRVFLEELSYKHEAYNAARFARMFENNMGVYIPAVYYEHSTDKVLTLEDVTSIKVTDYAALERAGINRKAVAKRLMDTYLTQIFNEYFFHADPHPGNLFVYPLPVEDETKDFGPEGRPFYLIFVDFGMTGTLTKEIADSLVSTLAAVFNRDTKGLIEAYVRLGFILPGADLKRITEATEEAFDRVWGLSMEELRNIEYSQVTDLADEVSDLLLSMPFYIPQDFLYLGRTVSILSGMCTSLDPAYNPWHELQPYTEVLIARGFGYNVNKGEMLDGGLGRPIISGILNGNTKVLRNVGEEIIRRSLPPQVNRVDKVMKQLEEGDVHIIAEMSLAQRQQLRRLEKETRRTSRSVFFGSVFVSSTILYTSGEPTLAFIGYAVCGMTVFVGVFRD